MEEIESGSSGGTSVDWAPSTGLMMYDLYDFTTRGFPHGIEIWLDFDGWPREQVVLGRRGLDGCADKSLFCGSAWGGMLCPERGGKRMGIEPD